jgi:hypothetical protein
MKKQKKFDCVQMKWNIQQKIKKEFAGISDDVANRIQMERITKNSILGPFLKKVRTSNIQKTQDISIEG